jgi:hypothetical protein
MNDVAIIGVGLHPFGRFDGKSAMEMGADAIHVALADAGVQWRDVQFGVGGSYEVSNPDAVTRLVGLTGIPFINVFNACAEDFTLVGPFGFVLDKAAWLDRYRSGDFVTTSLDWHDVTVRTYDDTAITIGTQTQQAAYQGNANDGDFRISHVFVRRDGEWKLANTHLSLGSLPGPPPGGPPAGARS